MSAAAEAYRKQVLWYHNRLELLTLAETWLRLNRESAILPPYTVELVERLVALAESDTENDNTTNRT
jgi:hypothetical protein